MNSKTPTKQTLDNQNEYSVYLKKTQKGRNGRKV